jgi:hypothetical protein
MHALQAEAQFFDEGNVGSKIQHGRLLEKLRRQE